MSTKQVIKLTPQEETSETLENMLIFINGSSYTKKNYILWLRKFMRFCKVTNPDDLLYNKNGMVLERKIFSFIKDERENQMSSPGTIHSYVSAVKLFYIANRVEGISWTAVSKVKGQKVMKVHDKPYDHAQITKLLTKADERTRILVLLMASAGLRRGALPSMKVGDLSKVKIKNSDLESSLYQIEVYNNTEDHYTTFCTPECASAIDFYLDYRRRYGETITEDSPLLREQFNKQDKDSIVNPRHITIRGIETLIYYLQYSSGVLAKSDRGLPLGQTRHKMMSAHGLRKFFRTQCGRSSMNVLATETLMGHDTGLQKVYFKLSPEDLLKEYVKAIINLTINSVERERLRVRELEVQSRKQTEIYTKTFEEERKRHEDNIAQLNDMLIKQNEMSMKMQKQIDELEKKQKQN